MSKKLLSLLLVLVIALGWGFTVSLFFDTGEEELTKEEIDMIAYYREIGEEQRSLGAYGKESVVRTWTEAYDMLAAIAINELGKKQEALDGDE